MDGWCLLWSMLLFVARRFPDKLTSTILSSPQNPSMDKIELPRWFATEGTVKISWADGINTSTFVRRTGADSSTIHLTIPKCFLAKESFRWILPNAYHLKRILKLAFSKDPSTIFVLELLETNNVFRRRLAWKHCTHRRTTTWNIDVEW